MITIAELHRAIEAALRKDLLAKDAEARAAFQALSMLLADYPDLCVDAFCVKAREGLQKTSKAEKAATAPKAKPATMPKSPAVSEPAISRYLSELERTKADSRQFETVVDRMKRDKEVRVVDAREIAKRFTGRSQSYKSKPEAAKAILQRQITDVRAAGKAGHIADIF
jgi:hypothetical protein